MFDSGEAAVRLAVMDGKIIEALNALEARVAAIEEQRAEPRFATIFQVAKYLNVATSSIRRWTAEGCFPSYGPPKRRRWDLNEVDAYFFAHRNEA